MFSGRQSFARQQSSVMPRPVVKTPSLFILVAVTAVGPLALNVFIPSMPGMQTVFGVDYGTIQLTLTLYLAATAVAQLVWGPLSDRFGRRPVLLAGLTLFVIGSTLAAVSVSISMLIGSRVVQAVGGCAGMVLGRAIVRDLFDRDAAASKIAYITMAMVVAPMIAPALGGLLDQWFNWRAGFILVGVVGTAVWLAATLTLHESHHQRRPLPGIGGLLSGYSRLLRSALFCGYAFNMAFSAAVFFSFLAGAPYIMVELLGRTPGEYGLYFVMVSGGYMLGNLVAGRFSGRVGSYRMLLIGSGLAISGTTVMSILILSAPVTPLVLFGSMMVLAFANGLCLPNATAGAISVDPDAVGAASGLAGFLQIATGALATWLVGSLQNDSALPMTLVMTASAWIAFGALLVVLRYQADPLTVRRNRTG